jgi:hypothetical protein
MGLGILSGMIAADEPRPVGSGSGAAAGDVPRDLSVKLLERVLPLLDALHDCGTARDHARNRTLFYDDYVKLVLLYLFNPLLQSISALQRAALVPRLARQLGIRDFSKASFSEAPAVFDSSMLLKVIDELAGPLRPFERDPKLADIRHAITLADGTLLRALPKLVETLHNSCRPSLHDARCTGRAVPGKSERANHAWRVHTFLDLDHFVPSQLVLTGASRRGANDERRVLEANVGGGHVYVCDRGYFDKSLLNAVVAAGSLYVMRAMDNVRFEVVEERLLSREALDAGVVRDAVVRMEGLDHPTRLIEVQTEVHAKRTRKGIVPGSGTMKVLCPELSFDPEVIALLYRHRWTVEVFFKFLKQLLGCRHLLSQRKTGVEIQIYCAVIVCMLLNMTTGLRPARAVMEVITWYMLGLADPEDVVKRIEMTRIEQQKRAAKKRGV